MSLEEIISSFVSLELATESFPHGSNLQTKSQNKLSPAQELAIGKAIPAYLLWHTLSTKYEKNEISLSDLLNGAERYYDLIRSKEVNQFSAQSDFTSSLLPELLCVFLRRIIRDLPDQSFKLKVISQKSLTIDASFDVSNGGRIVEKRKRMDIAIVSPTKLNFNGVLYDFPIPAMCMEVKTNIDKNMLSGIESSVDILKRTFPQCRYYVMGEFSDFDISEQNYASTGIDEILIVRKQKRSEVRRNPAARNFFSEELFVAFGNEIIEHLVDTVLVKPDLSVRMKNGKLI
jgi:hypothetical protein